MNELEKLEAELTALRAELAELEAGKPPVKEKKTTRRANSESRRSRPAREKMHHPESGLTSSIEGYGGPAPVGESRYRTSNRPIVMKDVSPFDRPASPKVEERECLYLTDVADGRPESDSWKRCKCWRCAEYI